MSVFSSVSLGGGTGSKGVVCIFKVDFVKKSYISKGESLPLELSLCVSFSPVVITQVKKGMFYLSLN